MFRSTPLQATLVVYIAPVRAKIFPQRKHPASAIISVNFIFLIFLILGGPFPWQSKTFVLVQAAAWGHLLYTPFMRIYSVCQEHILRRRLFSVYFCTLRARL